MIERTNSRHNRGFTKLAICTGGTLLVNGRTFTPAQGATLGYLPEERVLYKKAKVIDVMVYLGRISSLAIRESSLPGRDGPTHDETGEDVEDAVEGRAGPMPSLSSRTWAGLCLSNPVVTLAFSANRYQGQRSA